MIIFFANILVSACSSKACSKEEIWELLRYNRETLEEYIAVEVPQETIESCIIRKAKMKLNQGIYIYIYITIYIIMYIMRY